MADRTGPATTELEAKKRYDPSEVEPRIVERWLASGVFHPEPAGTAGENFSVAIPPPNVTGVLHMGHALNDAVQDCLIRHARARGMRTKWILGTDHAGIATQTQVERELRSLGSSRQELGREQFIGRVWAWRERYGHRIVEQLKRLGASCDYGEERFTMDERYADAVLRVFVALYEQGLIYRDRYMVNWDPGSGSAISDLEVEDHEVTDTLYHIDYPCCDGDGVLTVATVRPETMLGDVAVAVHPEDERYRELIGSRVRLPITERELPVIADPYVRRDFGTGALKITPGHDPNDFEIGRRHGLPEPSVIGEDGRMCGDLPERYRGLTVAEAQQRIVAELRELGRLRAEEHYTHEVPFSQRSGERIEPLISLQWFMRMDELAGPAIAAVREGRIRIHPESQSRRYLDWLENIRPWCISRQLWWGHQLPVWYREGQEPYVGAEPPAGTGWERDPDVLDTWFSSALWPFATLGWPEQTAELQAFYPTSVLSTARDIIFLWVARMVMMGLRFTGEIPFSDVYVHSIIQAPDGRRMSKSLGTGIDPLDLIEGGPRPPVFARDGGDPGSFPAYGADAVRWGLLAMSSGQDVRFSEERVAQGQALTNKLWNAARLILMRVRPDARPAPHAEAVEDRWILSRLRRAAFEVGQRIERFEFSRVALELYDFVYGELCDWYLELVKPRLYEGDRAAAGTLLHVLERTLVMAHPVIPFVTEEIHSHMPGAEGLLAARVVGGPQGTAPQGAAAEAAIARAIQAIQGVRAWRDSAEVRPSATLTARLHADGYELTRGHLARLARLELDQEGDRAGEIAARIPVPGGAVEIIDSGAVDLRAAERRRAARRAELDAEIARSERKLSDHGFVSRAPERIVSAEREKLERLLSERSAL
jgi:valyl-tRNA synthetase